MTRARADDNPHTLRSVLEAAGRVRWLDVGSGGRADPGFDLMDVFPDKLLDPAEGHTYFRADIVNLTDEFCDEITGYDLVRMQHVLEHLTFEDGLTALTNCGRLLSPAGYLMITVPDLAVHAKRYLSGRYDQDPSFLDYATERIPRDAPASAFFAVFAHSLTFEPHKWCYDFEGLEFQVTRTGLYEEVRRLELDDELTSTPFTHNRPAEDVCLLARRC